MIKEAFAASQIDLTTVGVGLDGATGLGTIISNGIKIVVAVALIAFLAMLIFGALEWIISGGEKEKVANARGRITNALIGLAILGLAFVIVTVAGNMVGITNVLNLTIPNLGD